MHCREAASAHKARTKQHAWIEEEEQVTVAVGREVAAIRAQRLLAQDLTTGFLLQRLNDPWPSQVVEEPEPRHGAVVHRGVVHSEP